MISRNVNIILGMVGTAVAASLVVVWAVYFNTPEAPEQPPAQQLGQGENLVPVSPSIDPESEALPTIGNSEIADIFKIHNGPIAGATLFQTTRPTTTVARFMLQQNGHTFDLPLDSPGSIPKAVSNITVPGVRELQWGQAGRVALARYLDNGEVKTASFTFSPVGTTSTPVRVQFLPSAITSVALSPDGTKAAYLLRGQNGAEGYVADYNGGNARRAFSLPLSQINLSWPSASTLLAVSAPASGTGGIIFTVDAQSGATTPLLFAEGLSAIANQALTHLVYHTAGAAKTTYAYDTATGGNRVLSFDPLPEQCKWGRVLLYCPVALDATTPNYIDLFNQGRVTTPSGVAVFNPKSAATALVALPGGSEGGEEADIAEIALSPDESYLLYITKGDRSLWGVRLK